MAGMSQARLLQKLDRLLQNGELAAAQAVLARVGYTPEKLAEGRALRNSWQASKAQRPTLVAHQKTATDTVEAAERTAERLITNFQGTLRSKFKGDEPLLTSLGIRTNFSKPGDKAEATSNSQNGQATNTNTNTTTATNTTAETDPPPAEETTPAAAEQTTTTEDNQNGQTQTSRRSIHSLATKLERWDLFLAGVENLTEEQKAILALAGWAEADIAEVTTAVRAVIEAGVIQRQRFHDRQAESTRCQDLEAETRAWYIEATRVIVLGIKRHAPKKEAELRQLLDL